MTITLTSEECERLGRALSDSRTLYHVTHDGRLATAVAKIVEDRMKEQA